MIYEVQRNVTFAAQTTGEYKFCYKKSSDTIYTCTGVGEHINVTTINTPISYPVTMMFDSEDCTHSYDILVAPLCDETLEIEINALIVVNCKTYNIQKLTTFLTGNLLVKGCVTNNYTSIPYWFVDQFRLIGGLDVCSSETPSTDAGFTVTEGVNCNCQCREWNVSLTSTGGSLNILYTSCMGEIVFESLSGPFESLVFCAVGDVSVASQNLDPFTKVDQGIC
jgi:hypothetical protein